MTSSPVLSSSEVVTLRTDPLAQRSLDCLSGTRDTVSLHEPHELAAHRAFLLHARIVIVLQILDNLDMGFYRGWQGVSEIVDPSTS